MEVRYNTGEPSLRVRVLAEYDDFLHDHPQYMV